MKNVVWSARASRNVADIAAMVFDYAGEHSAARYVAEFNRLVDLAAANPNMGKIGLANTRELYPLNGKYRIVYEVAGDDLNVLAVKPSQMLHETV